MLSNQNSLSGKDFLIKVNKKFNRVKLDEVNYLRSDGKYVTIVLDDREFAIRSTLKNLLPLLSEKFIRTHTSYIVNSEKIMNVQNNPTVVTLENGEELMYSRTFKNNLFDVFIVG